MVGPDGRDQFDRPETIKTRFAEGRDQRRRHYNTNLDSPPAEGVQISGPDSADRLVRAQGRWAHTILRGAARSKQRALA